MGKIYVLGTSHIARESIDRIKKVYEEKKPEIIGVELDEQRLFALIHHQKTNLGLRNLARLGLTSYLFLLIGSFVQKKLGEMVGIKPGADMLYASKLALKDKKTLLLMDQDIQITLRQFSKRFSFKEKMNIAADVIKGVFLRKKFSFDLTKVPEEELVNELLAYAKKRYPNAYNVLIDERNKVMAQKLVHAHNARPAENILAVVGAGHKQGIIRLLKQALG